MMVRVDCTDDIGPFLGRWHGETLREGRSLGRPTDELGLRWFEEEVGFRSPRDTCAGLGRSRYATIGIVTDEASASPTGASSDPGDLGRRVAFRRQALGITQEELAQRSRMSPTYIDYIEGHAAEVTSGGVLRLAEALDTTPVDLLGHGIDRPPGHGPAARHPQLEDLSEEETQRLFQPGGVGRVVLVQAGTPMALPVNFAVLDGDIVFRATSSSPEVEAEGQTVGFEVDRIDDAMKEGWTVMASGRLRRVDEGNELDRSKKLGIEPWAGGERDVFLSLTPSSLSGRRIRAR